jgi:hypothetical protein
MCVTSEIQPWHGHRDDLLREAERRRLIGELRAAGQKERFRPRDRARAKSRTKASVPPTNPFRGELREEDRGLEGVSHR